MVGSMGGGTDNESGRGPQMDKARRENQRVTERTQRPTDTTIGRREYGNSKLAKASPAGRTSARVHAPKGMK